MSAATQPRTHGDVDAKELARLGIDRAQLLDLSSNLNPLGPHAEVVHAVQCCALHSYPDRHATLAKQAIASLEDVHPDGILLGHGAAELLFALVTSLTGQGRPLLIVGPTFSEPQTAAIAYGLPSVQVCMTERSAFELDAQAIDAAIAERQPGAVYLCHPNNPTGRALPLASLRALLSAHRSTTFILDQAFLSLSARHEEGKLRFGEHVVLVRSLTKDHALAGLRVAYALCRPDLVARLEGRRPPWMISSGAQAAIVAALAHPEHVALGRDLLLDGTRGLHDMLDSLSLQVVPSEAPFLLVRVGDAEVVRERLLRRHHILVRSCASFGLADHIRLLGCDAEARARLLCALQEELVQ